MGAKTSILAFVESDAAKVLQTRPKPDRAATGRLVARLFPTLRTAVATDADLSSYPRDNEILAACFPGLSIVCAADFSIDYPSRIPPVFLRQGEGSRIYLHAMHSVVDWFAYALWDRGTLVRSLSLSPDSGVLEDVGARRPVEAPYWGGQHPVGNDYPLPFHPLELAEDVLRDLFGFVLEGATGPNTIDPFDIPLVRYVRD